MLDIEVALDFQCCSCGSDMGVTLRCEGGGLSLGEKTLATVKVPCPSCQKIIQLFFSPDGTLYKVEPDSDRLIMPKPSLN